MLLLLLQLLLHLVLAAVESVVVARSQHTR